MCAVLRPVEKTFRVGVYFSNQCLLNSWEWNNANMADATEIPDLFVRKRSQACNLYKISLNSKTYFSTFGDVDVMGSVSDVVRSK